jgi:AraC-like DNA-binding protein
MSRFAAVSVLVPYGSCPEGEEPATISRLVSEILDLRPVRGEPAATTGKQCRILLYCTDLGALGSLVVGLRGAIEISAALSVGSAQRLLNERFFDAVMVDVREWSQSAIAFIHSARANQPTAPILALGTERSFGDVEAALPALGIQVVIAASETISDLFQAVIIGARTINGECCPPVLQRPTRRAVDYFGQHYAETAHGCELARHANVSFYHLAHLFRVDLNASIKEYMTEVRAEVARQLILETGEKIEIIAERAGFSDASHLSRTFLRRFGERPGQYRHRTQRILISSRKIIPVSSQCLCAYLAC